ncbi:MAG: hypothetical protein K2J59_08285 [Eubacterium sp.]|nr:hypothetical protein [Eubacterium sp.]MDE6752750.1 hypothetical protein [Eubacterium sp.]
MSVTDAQKKANRKWDKTNMITIGCKLYRNEAELFKEYAASQGKTANTILKEYVKSCNDKYIKDSNNEEQT